MIKNILLQASRSYNPYVPPQTYLWGAGRVSHGELANGETLFLPAQVGTLTDWSIVSSQGNRVMAIKTDGTLWGWGENSIGSLGDGTTGSKSSPVQIGSLTDWQHASAGGSRTFAIKTDGTLWAWGNNGTW